MSRLITGVETGLWPNRRSAEVVDITIRTSAGESFTFEVKTSDAGDGTVTVEFENGVTMSVVKDKVA